MSKPEHTTTISRQQQKILDYLEGGLRTWDQLRKLTKTNDDQLGYTLGELLNQRKIWTTSKGDVRVYGIERRMGLTPRFANDRRAVADSNSNPGRSTINVSSEPPK